MSWAAGRRLVILLIIGSVVAAFAAILFISVFYKAPSCSDGVQNQGEAGVDCGGPCVNRCATEEQSPTVLFTKAVPNGAGRIDAVAEVENKNPDAAARNVAYTITFYGAGQTVVAQASGTLDLPPNATVPVFVPGVSSGNEQVVNAFLEINASSLKWVSMPTDTRIVPHVSTPQLEGTVSAPRVEVILSNTSVTTLANVRAIVLIHDSAGDVIAASSTILPTIPAQGQATALFTWSAAFTSVPALIEVIPVIPLP